MFVISSISVAVVVFLPNDTSLILLATTSGFLITQDIFTSLKLPLYLLSLISGSKLLQSTRNHLMNRTFVSYFGWDCRKLSSLKILAIHYLVSIIKGAVLLGSSLAIVYFSYTSSAETKELGTRITAGLVIGLFCLLQGSYVFQRIHLFRVLRNPLFPKQYENVSKFERKRMLLHYFSTPGRYIHAYCKSK